MKIYASLLLFLTGILSLYFFGAPPPVPGGSVAVRAASATPVPAARKRASETAGQAHYTPKEGFVSDEQTAIAIAVAVWTPIYGKEQIESEKPYKAVLKNGVWTVRGSLPEGFNGGVAEIDIAKTDGRISRVMHGE